MCPVFWFFEMIGLTYEWQLEAGEPQELALLQRNWLQAWNQWSSFFVAPIQIFTIIGYLFEFRLKEKSWYFVCSSTLNFCSTYLQFTREKRQRDRPLSKHKKKRSLVHTTCSFTKRCTMRKLEAHFAIQIRKIHIWKKS